MRSSIEESAWTHNARTRYTSVEISVGLARREPYSPETRLGRKCKGRKMINRFLLVMVTFALGLASRVDAATLCVNEGGTGGCSTSIQSAVDAAAPYDQIVVAPGTYFESVDLPALRNVTIEGAGPSSTVLQVSGPLAVGIRAADPRTRVIVRGIAIRGSIDDQGRGVVAVQRAKVRLVDCEIAGHDLGIAADEGARFVLDSSWVHGNRWGVQYYGRSVEIVRSTVSDNLLDGVVSVWGFSTSSRLPPRIRITDSTVSGNGGAGIAELVGSNPRSGRVARSRISRSTIVGNAAGISVSEPSPDPWERYQLDATILAANGIDCDKRLVSLGFNFIGSVCASAFVVGAGATLDVVGDDPMLGPLQQNGGVAPSQEPLPGSPVLEVVGPRSVCRNADQGLFPRLPAPCDIGAVELP